MTDLLDNNPKTVYGIRKPTFWAIPWSALTWLGQAMECGRRKYGLMNWRHKKVTASVYIDAAMRHIGQWVEGEELSDDDRVHHLAHAMACLAIVIDAQQEGVLIDNRPTPGHLSELFKSLTRTE